MRQEPSKTLSLLFEAPLCHRRAKQDDFRERCGGSYIGDVASRLSEGRTAADTGL